MCPCSDVRVAKYVMYTTYLYCTGLYMPSYVNDIIDFKTMDLFLEDNSSVVKLFVIRDGARILASKWLQNEFY